MAEEIKETQEMAQAAPVVPPKEETFEEKQERLKREDYTARNAEALKERERILRSNGLLKPGEPFVVESKWANRKCCF